MKRENKLVSIRSQMFWLHIVIGTLWIGVGISNMFDNLFFDIVHAVLLVSTIVVVIIIWRSNCEENDEMSEYNHMKAKAKAHHYMNYVYCGGALISSVLFSLLQVATDFDIYWVKIIVGIFFILMGIQDLITGIVFNRLEAE